jgi:hypothetical protein
MRASDTAARASPAPKVYALSALLVVVVTSGVARSESVNWNTSPPGPGNPSCPDGGPWSNGNCWIYGSHAPTLRIPPRTGDTASIFKVGGTVTLDTNIDLENLAVSGGPFEQGSYRVQASGEAIGLVGEPTTWNQTGGSNTATALGLTAGAYELTGGKVTTGSLGISTAVGASATFDQQGARTSVTVTSGPLSSAALAVGAFGNGTYKLQGGQLSAKVESIGVGPGSNGMFVQTGGSNSLANSLRGLGTLFIGTEPGSTGRYQLSGGQSVLSANTEIVGVAGAGTLQQAGGVNAAETLYVGLNGVGSVDQSGGGSTTATLGVGAGRGGSGTYTLSGYARLNAASETIGSQLPFGPSPGLFDQRDASSNTISGTLLISKTSPVSRYLMNGPGAALQAGYIDNYGTFELKGGSVKTGTLDNFGKVTYELGSLTADVTNESGATFKTVSSGPGSAPLTLHGSFDNRAGARLDVSGAITMLALHDAGPVVFDPSTAEVSQITVSATGYLEAGGGSELKVDGDFANQSTQRALWNTSQATLDFSGAGTHRFVLNGTAGAGAANNYAWGTLTLDPGSVLDLMAGTGDALYVGTLQGVDTAGSRVSNIEGSANVVLYYDAADNPTLRGSYRLVGGGELIPTGGTTGGGTTGVPEPGTLGLLAAGLALSRIGSPRRRRPRNAG